MVQIGLFGSRYTTGMKFAAAFGLIFVVIGSIYYIVSKDLGGAFLLLALGVAMGTMALILLHAMNSEA